MTKVFIAGSINIKTLHSAVKERIDKIIALNYHIIVGDANGVDAAIQLYLSQNKFDNVTVYCTGNTPRNNINQWPVFKVLSKFTEGSRAFFTAKDLQMALDADYGFMVWDTKSTGTLKNTIELLKQKKKAVVFINKDHSYKTISNVTDLEALLKLMSENAAQKAEKKIHISREIQLLKHEQITMF